MLKLLDRVARGALRLKGVRRRVVSTTVGPIAALEHRGAEGHAGGHYVLIHGLGTSAAGYTSVVQQLLPHAARIIAVDLPGHGDSAPIVPLTIDRLADGLLQALESLVERPAVFLGTSLGGAAALRVALARPDWVASLVLASPAGAPLDDAELAALRARFDLRDPRDARRFFGDLFHRPPIYARLLERGLIEQLGSPAVRSFLAQVGPQDFFGPEELARLSVPTTVLWGRSDTVLPRSSLAFFRRHLPHARLVEVDAVGHSPHTEDAPLVARTLRAAWDRSRDA